MRQPLRLVVSLKVIMLLSHTRFLVNHRPRESEQRDSKDEYINGFLTSFNHLQYMETKQIINS